MDLNDMLPTPIPVDDTVWSPFQTAIFDRVANTKLNLAIEAVAGSGKTTTICEAVRRLPQGTEAMFLAFNKSIVRELATKLPYSTECKTLNGLGHGLLARKLRSLGAKTNLNAYKMWDVAREVLTEEQWEEYGTALIRFVSLARANAIGILTENNANVFYSMLGDFEVDIPEEYETLACRQASEILRRMINSVEKLVDFDDQLYMPVYYQMRFPHFDVVFIDEAQDLSTIQHIMLERLAEAGARIIAVGDSRQAIYGFRGADTKSMSNLAERFEMEILPLSISYRCPKNIVKEAQQIVYHIQASETAIDGEVKYLDLLPEPKDFPVNCMVLCRLNAPLFSLALKFLQDRLPCHVMSNFGKDLVSFVKKFEVKTTEELSKELSKWLAKEKLKAEAKGWWGKAQLLQDRYDALIPFCDHFALKVQVVAALQQLLTTESGPRLSTIHKAKGLESPTVYLLRPEFLGGKLARTDAQQEQELNLKYVAVTRAQENLVYLPEEME